MGVRLVHRIEVGSKVLDTRALVRLKKLESIGLSRPIEAIEIIDVYTIDARLIRHSLDTDRESKGTLDAIASMLVNPIEKKYSIDTPLQPERFDWAIEIGFLPGVTDNVGHTAKQGIEDLLKMRFAEDEAVYTSQVSFLHAKISKAEIEKLALTMANPLIQRVQIKSYDEFMNDNGMGIVVPKVNIHKMPAADIVDILHASDAELSTIGKQGIANQDGSRRGPLALDLQYMKTIQEYFKKKGRNPTDVEIESLAQTWSEHCKHTIFGDPIDEIEKGIFKTYIKDTTEKIRTMKGKDDLCISVFTDNAGGIAFDEQYLVCIKVETHNSPSALDPFGGAITGIVGVNRDPMGFGLGAKPIINMYGFCFGNPDDTEPIYKSKEYKDRMLTPRRIMDGVIDGVNVGGNCSGIPTPQGFVFFDDSYKGKPLVFVGTVGILPRTIQGKPSHQKSARAGDYIVMVGGRVGKDGIHGATFSSEALDSGSPATAVQIGDPITQKKVSDVLIFETRDELLYSDITDNGAGGLSCSVGEMAKSSGGYVMHLDKVPLKYPGLEPWEISTSESQERMTLAVPKEHWPEFQEHMLRRNVEATIIGEFTDSGKCIAMYNGETVMDIDLEFLHDGLPQRAMQTKRLMTLEKEPSIPLLEDLTDSLHAMLARRNITSYAFISSQYDHEVQGGSVTKPLQGRGSINADATVTKPVFDSKKGLVLSQGLAPRLSEIDSYHMAANAIDSAIRAAVAAGADPSTIHLLDNFCWCSSTDPGRLAQLKEAARACHDYALAYKTPFISGKDSMFNDFKGYDTNNNPIKISVLPTLLITAMGIIPDTNKAVTLDAKYENDIIYVLGETTDETAGSEYFSMHQDNDKIKHQLGINIPVVEAQHNAKLYRTLHSAMQEDLVASAISISRGGLAVALAKTAMGGMHGMQVDLTSIPGSYSREDFALYSESPGRFVVTVSEENQERFEKLLFATSFGKVGRILKTDDFIIKGLGGKKIVQSDVHTMLRHYVSTFAEY
jgi:phosphoribosylformylglycinamidine synthase subunit PurSL